MVAATFFAVLTRRQESQTGSLSDFLIGRLSLGAYCIIYTDGCTASSITHYLSVGQGLKQPRRRVSPYLTFPRTC